MKDRWMLYAVSARATSDHSRRAEGLYILDEATEWLFDRSHVDKECFSTPANIQITGRDRLPISPTTYTYTLSFETERTVSKRDRRTFPKWSSINTLMPSTTGGIVHPGDQIQLIDMSVPIP